MVLVLPANRQKGFAESVLGGFAEGIPSAIQQYQQMQQQRQQFQAENAAAKQMGIDLSGVQDPKMRQAIVAESLRGQQKQQLLGQKQEYLNQIFGAQQQGVQRPFTETPEEMPQQNGFDASQLSDEDIARASVLDPNLGRSLQHAKDVALREGSEKRGREERTTISKQKETLSVRKDFADKAKYARQGIENKKLALALLKKGDIDDPLTVQLASYLPGALGNKLLSSDTQLYKAGLFEEFGVLKSMFPGQIRVKEIELLEDKLATLEKSHEAKAKILENGMLKLERDVILGKAAREVEKENPNASLLEFDELVAKKAEPKLNKLYNKITKGYEKIYEEFSKKESKSENNMIDVIGPDGELYEIDKNEVDMLPEGFRIK